MTLALCTVAVLVGPVNSFAAHDRESANKYLTELAAYQSRPTDVEEDMLITAVSFDPKKRAYNVDYTIKEGYRYMDRPVDERKALLFQALTQEAGRDFLDAILAIKGEVDFIYTIPETGKKSVLKIKSSELKGIMEAMTPEGQAKQFVKKWADFQTKNTNKQANPDMRLDRYMVDDVYLVEHYYLNDKKYDMISLRNNVGQAKNQKMKDLYNDPGFLDVAPYLVKANLGYKITYTGEYFGSEYSIVFAPGEIRHIVLQKLPGALDEDAPATTPELLPR